MSYYITAILMGILGCVLSFAAGVLIDSAVNTLTTRMDKEMIITLKSIIKTQEDTNEIQRRTIETLQRR